MNDLPHSTLHMAVIECSSCSVEFFMFHGILEVWWNFGLIWWWNFGGILVAKCIESMKVPSLELEQMKKFRGTTVTL